MKFQRNARILRSQLDAAPFASVFFLLAIFLLLSSLIYTPGVHIQLPAANGLAGTDKPTVAVAVDANGRLYFGNQLIDEDALMTRLRNAVTRSAEPLALIVQADKAVTHEMLVHVSALAQQAGIAEAVLATLPRPVGGPGQPTPP
jgi:biopolymer transport protein ExbD